jgi:ATP-dependent Clp protease protease subunit
MSKKKLDIDIDELLDSLGMQMGEGVANVQLPDPDLMAYYDQLENREIWLDSSISISTLTISKLIMHFNKVDDRNGTPVEERKPIKIFIYSYGGEVAACFNLVDTIQLSKTPVYTYNMGVAMSAAFVILLAGHKRFALPRSTALVHSGSGTTQGTFEQTEAQMKDYKHSVEVMRNYVLSRTTIDQKTFNKNKNSEWYLYIEDQLKYGIVNEEIKTLENL